MTLCGNASHQAFVVNAKTCFSAESSKKIHRICVEDIPHFSIGRKWAIWTCWATVNTTCRHFISPLHCTIHGKADYNIPKNPVCQFPHTVILAIEGHVLGAKVGADGNFGASERCPIWGMTRGAFWSAAASATLFLQTVRQTLAPALSTAMLCFARFFGLLHWCNRALASSDAA